MLEDRLRWLDEQVTERDGRIAALGAALARASANLTTACILIGNLLSSDDDADVAAGRAFIDAVVARRESVPISAGTAGEEEDRDV